MTRRSFHGATVVVSGAAGGLGRALASSFARAGSRVVLLDRDAEAVVAAGRDLEQAGHQVLALACDVTDPAACDSAVTLALARFGRIDVVINNAGITHRSAFAATRTDVLRRVMEVNLFGAINLTRAALPSLQVHARPGHRDLECRGLHAADCTHGLCREQARRARVFRQPAHRGGTRTASA